MLTVGLTALVVLVVVVSGASVALTVDSGSRPSGLTMGGVVAGGGGPAVLESSGVSEGVMAGGRVGSTGAGETSAEDVCVLTVAAEVVGVAVGPVDGEVDQAVVVLMELVGRLDVGVGEGGVTGAIVIGALIPATIKHVLGKINKDNVILLFLLLFVFLTKDTRRCDTHSLRRRHSDVSPRPAPCVRGSWEGNPPPWSERATKNNEESPPKWSETNQ